MATLRTVILLLALCHLLCAFSTSNVSHNASTPVGTDYWMSQIKRQGTVSFGKADFKVFRNIKDYGAQGDGTTDDTDAINAAIVDGTRCGQGCDSSTTTPALVYFPPGIYLISSPIIQLYYTQIVGDALSLPTLKAKANFTGIALIDSDPYSSDGTNWYINQNNFFRQIRNLVIDTTAMPVGVGAGIHWQVAQATSLQNIVFNMRTDGGPSNAQKGIFMDNGSGGFMTDLTFNGGRYGAFLGNQQFTTRNLTFNDCQTAIFMNWNWAWTFSGLSINNCGVGIDMANGNTTTQTVGSVLVLDSVVSNTPIGVLTAYSTTEGSSNGTLIIDNVDFTKNVSTAVREVGSGKTVLAGNTKVSSFVQGRQYSSKKPGGSVQSLESTVTKPRTLLDSTGKVFSRSKPQYETEPVTAFLSVKSAGAKGDGVTDDTRAIQAVLDGAKSSDIVYFDHGAYVVTSTVKVPKDIRITGEIWPLIMARGTSFQDQKNPTPVFKVGEIGDIGSVEISDLIFETMGPQPGAILVEWNVAEASQGSVGIWDVHFRIGGTAGSQLQSNICGSSSNTTTPANNTTSPTRDCMGAFMLLHITKSATIYIENSWLWTADHELDLSDHAKISVFNGRGVFIESENGPVWMYGTSAEHSVLYNYQIANAANIFMALIQTETPYFQSNPDATKPFDTNVAYSDPEFSGNTSVNKAWGLRILNSTNISVFGAGLYSFYDDYDQNCLETENCQSDIISLEHSTGVHLFGVSTKASVNMVSVNGVPAATEIDNYDNFCATIAMFEGQ